MSSQKSYLDKETAFHGRYSRFVYETLRFAYRAIFGRILFFMFCGFLGRLLLLSNANLIGIWVDSFCSQKDQSICRPVPSFFTGFTNSDYLLILVAVTLGGFLLTAFYRIGFSRSSAQAVSQIYDEVTLRTSRFPLRFFDINPVGRIVTRFSSDYSNVFRLFGGPLADFLAIMFDVASIFILISIASPYYLPIFLLVGGLDYLVYRFNRDSLRRERRALSASRSPSIAHFAETAQGVSTIRVFTRQKTFIRRFSSLNDNYLNQRLRTSKVVLGFSMQMNAMTAILLLITGLAGYYLALNGLASVGSIGVAFTFIILSGTSMQMFFEWMAQFEEAMTGVERLDEYLRRPIEPGSKLPAKRKFPTEHPVYDKSEEDSVERSRLVNIEGFGQKDVAQNASVDVENLWLKYGDNGPYVLKGLSFRILAGEKVGVIGRTGSGKTSFVQALFYLYPFSKGQIRIGGVAPKIQSSEKSQSNLVDLRVYRRSIAFISQDPTIFVGTIRENLDLTGSHDDRKLLEALQRVGLSEWIQSQETGLDSVMEERGRNLSAGERQLLCMARCLLQDAPVVIMDEATSAVDPQSEEILVRATREFFSDRTQIIIAHRLSTLEHCDRILWLHQGEIRMFGPTEEVLPVFRKTQLTPRSESTAAQQV